MTPSPENNEAGRLLDMEDEQNALRAEADKLRAVRDAKQIVLNERGLELDDWKRHHLALAQECDALRAEHERVKAELVETKRKLDNFLQQWIRIERQVECEPNDTIVGLVSRLRQQLTNAIDERNIARKESTALAEQLAAAHDSRQALIRENAERVSTAFRERNEAVKERDEARAQHEKLRERAGELVGYNVRDAQELERLRQRVTELEQALGGLMPFVMEEYHPDYATPDFKAAVERAVALAATAPDAQSTPPNP